MLTLPLGVTNLSPSLAKPGVRTKITPEGLAELVAVAGGGKAACRLNPARSGPACRHRSGGKLPATSALSYEG